MPRDDAGWADAIERVRGKREQRVLPGAGYPWNPNPDYRQACDGCGIEVVATTLRMAGSDGTPAEAWKSLCSRCRGGGK